MSNNKIFHPSGHNTPNPGQFSHDVEANARNVRQGANWTIILLCGGGLFVGGVCTGIIDFPILKLIFELFGSVYGFIAKLLFGENYIAVLALVFVVVILYLKNQASNAQAVENYLNGNGGNNTH